MANCIKCEKCGKNTLNISAITRQTTTLCSECLSQSVEFQASQTEKANHKAFTKRLNKVYNITIEDYNKMFTHQKGKCALCRRHQKEFNYRLYVDHNHTTGKVRGLLCNGCNNMVGLVENKQPTIKQVKKYLAKYDGQKQGL